MIDKKKAISDKAKEIGFDVIKFTKPEINNLDKKHLKKFLEKNHHGQMKWLERHYEKKINPKKVWNEVKTIVILGTNYGSKNNPLEYNLNKDLGNISIYARNIDYHVVIKKKLLILKKWLVKKFGINSKIFIDTSPIFEKSLAQQSGLGWHGKHTNIVSKEFGSWLFLSEIFISTKINIDNKEQDNCGTCNDCIKICPTKAFKKNYELDSRKCISYLTIEHKGPFPVSLRKKIGNKIYGCDDCLSICPWNKFSKETKINDFIEDNQSTNSKLSFFLKFNEEKFTEFFGNSSVKRIGWVSFLRNVLIASGNSKNKTLVKLIEPLLVNKNPLIRGTAIWSIRQLIDKKKFKEIKKNYFHSEDNRYVLFEWSLFKS